MTLSEITRAALLFVLFALGSFSCSIASEAANTAILRESGRLPDFIAELASKKYLLRAEASDSRPYVEPGTSLHAFRHLAQELAWGDVDRAARLAAQVDYQLVQFTDERTGAIYYALREDLSQVAAIRGWGSYLFQPHGQVDAIIEIPHPLADERTIEAGGEIFELSDAKGLLLAGAHRDKADVPDLVDSAFHQVHMAWVGPLGRLAAWQIHGFDAQKHEFPRHVSVVASTGDGGVGSEIVELDRMLEKRGLPSYVFNDLTPESRANRRLNGGIPGVTFTALAATQNEQGRYCRSVGGSFVHVELDGAIRRDRESRQFAATAIADAIRRAAREGVDRGPIVSLASFIPDPTAGVRTSDRRSSAGMEATATTLK